MLRWRAEILRYDAASSSDRGGGYRETKVLISPVSSSVRCHLNAPGLPPGPKRERKTRLFRYVCYGRQRYRFWERLKEESKVIKVKH